MLDLIPIRRALLSVSDKTDLIPFAKSLEARNVQIISTGGTAAALAEAGIAVTRIEDVTGFPEIMDGRVKTLHPKVHGALLGRRDSDAHLEAMSRHGIEAIDLVCVNLYPFEKTIANSDATRDEIIEKIDIGGPAMLRSAAKNHEFVTVVTSPTQYDKIVNALNEHDGSTTMALRQELAMAAFSRTAEYDATIAAWMSRRQAATMQDVLRISFTKAAGLRYGENPHQSAALYRDPASRGPTIVNADVLHGKPLSYNNINDASAAQSLVEEFDRPAAAVIKHMNACGCAVGADPAEAFRLAYDGDPIAAFGGILAFNRPVDVATADLIVAGQKFFEVIVAVRFDDEALRRLKERWSGVRLLAVGDHKPSPYRKVEYRSVPGGMLAQDIDLKKAAPKEWTRVAGPEPTAAQVDDAAFTWTVAKHLRSNAIALGSGGRLVGAGAGQMDRVTACRLAIEKAGPRARGSIAASDAFFPFPDGPEVLIRAGVTLIVQPGGSKRDADTLDVCEKHGVTLLFTGVRHFRH